MKILALRGQNLASLQQPFSIDFANGPLADIGLFSISGKTGSGKSTLLDAICLALFEKMPRLNVKKNDAEIGLGDETSRIKANDVRSILSRGKGEGFAEVDFAALDGSKWRARWLVRRARNSPSGRVQPTEHWLENLATGQRIAGKKQEVLSEIERLIGLSYEQFRRAVMLPQGDFAAFLKADTDSRANLLERMTGRAIYTQLSMAAFEKAKLQKNAREALENKLGGITLLTEEQLTELEALNEGSQQQLDAIEHKKAELHQHMQNLANYSQRQALLQQAQAELEAALDAQQQALPLQAKLAEVERVQPARQDFQYRSQLLAAGAELTHQVSAKQQQLVATGSQQQQAQQQLDEALSLLAEKEQRWQQLEPNLRQAASKETEMAALSDQQAELSQLIEQEQRASELQQQQLSAVVAKQTKLAQQIAALNTQQSAQQHLVAIADSEAFVRDELSQYDGFTKQLNRLQETITASKQARPKRVAAKQLVAQKQAALSDDIHQLKTKLAKFDLVGARAEFSNQQQILTTHQQQHEDNAKLIELAKRRLLELEKQQALKAQQTLLEQHCVETIDSLAQLDPQIVQNQTRLDEASHSVEQTKALLNLADYRATLVTGEPCPLCGAAEHPYADSQPVVEGLIATQQQRVKQLQALLNQNQAQKLALLQRQQDYQQQLTQLQQAQQAVGDSLALLADGFSYQQLNLDVTQFSHWLAGVTDNQNLLTQRLKQLAQALSALSFSINEAQELQHRLAAMQLTEAQYQQQLQQLENELSQHDRDLQQELATRDAVTKALSTAADKLNRLFTGDGWLTRLTELGIERYLTRLAAEVKEFVGLTEAIKQNEQALSACALQHASYAQAAANHAATLTGSQQKMQALAAKVAELKQARFALCAHPNLVEAEQQAKQQIKQALKGKTLAEQRLVEVKQQKVALQSALESLHAQQQKNTEDWQACAKRCQVWLAQFSLDEPSLTQLLGFDASWQQQQRQVLQRLADEVNAQRTRVSERKLSLDALQDLVTRANAWLTKEQALSAESQAELAAKLAAMHKEAEDHRFRYRQQLEAANQAKVQHAELIDQIAKQEQQARVWLQLDELIGSADGKKFRNLAQSLTLYQLTQIANQHLHELAPRYALQTVPSTPLALQVVDHDMGDEVRSVESLSGGESFLVSLALALALASLATDNRQLGSLFIDEGFGTLDPDSLEMALACLDTLQANGRQIGVISHVGVLVERIGAQIVVEAQGGGSSKVLVAA